MTDRALMARAHEGDGRAQLALLDRYVGPLFNLTLRTTGMMAVAEDVTRTVLSAALGRLSSRVPPPERRWIVELSRGLYRRLLELDLKPDLPTRRVRISSRYWQRERLELAEDVRGGPRRAAERLRRRLWRAWSALRMRERFVLALAETVPLSVTELGEVLGEPEAVARRIRDEAKLSLLARLAARKPSGPSPPLSQHRRPGR